MTWQQWVQQQAASLGLTVTSGYRTPQREAALGGPATSYHSTGTPSAPGAIDVGGSASGLTTLFGQVQAQFRGRINELYLNLPGGGSQDIKNNQPINTNPEAGRAQHLHIALSGVSSSVQIDPATGHVIDPTTGVPFTAGAQHYAASGASESDTGGACVRSLCAPSVLGGSCVCWSDIWVYGAALLLILGGGLLVTQGGKSAS